MLKVREIRTSTNRNINVKELTEDQFKTKYRRCVRHGKTRRKHANGSQARQAANHAARAAYVQWCASSASISANMSAAREKFPLGQCNGKKSRSLKSGGNKVGKQMH